MGLVPAHSLGAGGNCPELDGARQHFAFDAQQHSLVFSKPRLNLLLPQDLAYRFRLIGDSALCAGLVLRATVFSHRCERNDLRLEYLLLL